MLTTVRTDKWLWAARFFKTRGLAAEMCSSGKVRRLGHALKPASPLQPGDVLEIPFPEGPGTRVVCVISLIEKRQAAAEARACFKESTLPGILEAQRTWHQARNEGLRGRPTKKDRRNLDRIRGFFE